MKSTFCLLVALFGMLDYATAQDASHINDHLLFLSTFDDTTDVNLFGPDNDAGWIYTAESTKRVKVLMNDRCAEVSIDKAAGKIGDCLTFAAKTESVLFYQASPNLAAPCSNWAGTLSFWLKPDPERLGIEDCYPVQLSDGDWNHGGFFVRFPGKRLSTFEFGAVSASDSAEAAIDPGDVGLDQRFVTAVARERIPNDQWTMVTLTFESVNPEGNDASLVKFYLNGQLVGQIQPSLRIKWMDPVASKAVRDAAVFLGIRYVGGIDDLRIYEKALPRQRIQMLYEAAE